MRFANPPGPYGALYGASAFTLTGGAAHTKGSWTDLVASLNRDVMGVFMHPNSQVAQSGQNTSILLDLGIGGSGNAVDDTLVANVPVGYAVARMYISIPIGIRQGERLAARIQGTIASETIDLRVLLLYAPPPPMWAGFSRGEVITPMDLAASTPTMGDFTDNAFEEIIASTSRFYRAFNFFPAVVGGGASSGDYVIDIAVGASAAEQIIGQWAFHLTNTESIEGRMGPDFVERPIPAGSRLSVRKNGTGNMTGALVGYW